MPFSIDLRALSLALAAVGLAIVLGAGRGGLAFHTLVELFAAAIMFAAFATAWNARAFSGNSFLGLLGVACLFVGILDTLHALSQPGVGVFPDDGGNITIQLWLAARAVETGAVLAAALGAPRRLDGQAAFLAFTALTVGLIAAILGAGVFPDAYRPGVGLTPFKITAELALVAVKLASLAVVWRRRAVIGPPVARAVVLYLALTAGAEVAFCFYATFHEPIHVAGHLLKAAGFYVIYRTAVAHALAAPYQVLFHDLRDANERLEERVEQRTRLLAETDRALAAEIAERERLQVLERAIFLGAEHLMIATAVDGTILDLNPAAERALGYRRDELVGKATPLVFHDPDEVERRAAELGAALGRPVSGFEAFVAPIEGGRKAQREWTWYRRDGGRFPALVTVTRLHDRDGLPIGYVAIASDLSELTSLRAQAAQASSRLLDAIDSISEGFVLFDRDDRIVLCNRRLRELYAPMADLIVPGAAFADVLRTGVGRGHYDLGGMDVDEWLAVQLAHHREPSAPCERRLADGRWLLVSERRTSDGGIVSLRTDITTLKLTEAALKEINALNRALLRAVPLAVVVIDPRGTVLLWEGAAEQIFGWRADEVLGRPLPFVPEDDETVRAGLVGLVMRGQTLRELKVVRRRKDGRLLDLSLSAAPVRDDAGRVIGLMSLIEDVTERRRTESALIDSEERFRALVQNLPGLVFRRVLAPDGTIRYEYASEGFRVTFGLDPNELAGDPERFKSLIHPDDRERVRACLAQSARTLGTADIEFRAVTTEGETRWLHSVSQPRRRSTGEIVWDGLAFDVTERRRAAERQRTTEKALELSQRMEAVGQLAGGMAHEFNNMLVPMIGLVELTMMQLPEDTRPRRNLGIALEAAQRARELVRRILTFSRYSPQSGRAWPLRRAVSEALRIIRTVIPAPVVVREDIAEDELWTACEDGEVQQILINLTSNAAHAMMPKGGELTISLAPAGGEMPSTLDAGRRYARLTVRDTGAGMSEETRARVFEPFFTTKPVGEGTGIGLAVVHSIVTAHDGAVAVDSAPGQGTSFIIHLPIIDPEPVGNADADAEAVTA
ncbi:MAG TPA: MASE3 domain-containing protein [Azospirillum sp.]